MTDPIAALARWLAEHVEWLRHRAEVDEAYRDFAECASKLRHVVDGPLAKRYLGPCGAPASEVDELIDQYGDDPANGLTVNRCEGDVYGRVGAQHGTCRTCGAVVDQGARRAWLDAEVRQYAYTAAEIAAAYPIKRNTINVWASRGKLRAYWVTDVGLTIEWTEPVPDDEVRGPKVFYLGDVLDLAATDAARRETERSKRERRQETAA